MKLRSAQKIHYDTGPNMTPLVDIVIVILIFLMLTGTFAVGQRYLQSNVPVAQKATSGSTVKPKSVPDDILLNIRVDSLTRPGPGGLSQDVWSAQAGRITIQSTQADDTVAYASLVKQLTALREEFNAAGKTTDKIQVIIDPGRQTRYKHLVDVYGAALKAEFTKVAFATAH